MIPSPYLGMHVILTSSDNGKVSSILASIIGFDKQRDSTLLRSIPENKDLGWESLSLLTAAPTRENFLRAVDESPETFLSKDSHRDDIIAAFNTVVPYKEALKDMFRDLPVEDKFFLTKVVDVVITSVPK